MLVEECEAIEALESVDAVFLVGEVALEDSGTLVAADFDIREHHGVKAGVFKLCLKSAFASQM